MNDLDVGSKLKELRKAKHLNQQEVTDATGICRSVLSNFENGKRVPTLKNLDTLAKFYGVTLDFFNIGKEDELFDVYVRAKEVFENDNISSKEKDELYRKIMAVYLYFRSDEK